MKLDKKLLITVLLLSIFGLLMIYSASNVWAEYKYNDAYKFIKSQTIFFITGLFLIFIITKIDINLIKNNSNKILLICLLLLILVLIPGLGKVRNGSRSWFGLGPLGIQPSEFAKLGLIIYTAKYLSSNDKIIKNIKVGLLPLFIVILIFALLIMLEPDFGTMMVIILTLSVMIYVSGPNLKFFIKLGILGLLGVVGLIAIAPYRMKRIVSFLNPWSDPLGSGFQVIQSLYAIAPFSLLGTGFNSSIQKNFYLPEPQTDFIFSIIAEEFGILGCLFVIISFAYILYRSIKISLSQNDLFKKYLSFGLSFGIALQASLNLAVVTNLIPCTGITLPFLSYGGSSLLISMISIGLILNISKTTNN